jgi:5-methyltetrahydrofolate--homocysteine methyltransferase
MEKSAFLKALAERVIVFDGAMGTSIHARDLSVDDYGGPEFEGCPEHLLVTRPDVIAEIHASYFEAGADVVETNTFGGTSIPLAEYGLGDRAYEINRIAAELARKVASDFSTSDRPRWVAGSMGPGTKSPTLGQITYDAVRDAYEEQARGLVEGGADLLIVETCFDVLQTKASLAGIHRAFAALGRSVPVIAQVTIEQQGTMLLGTEIGAALTALEPLGISAVGMNCATGPRMMAEHVRQLCQSSPIPVSCLPNAGLPVVRDGATYFPEQPEEFADALAHFVKDFGVSIVGGCCGTTPAHIRAIVERVGGLAQKARTPEFVPASSSLYISQPHRQDTSFLVVGERVNASGSKKAREMLVVEDWDGLVGLAREQQREGAHVLDVNVDYVGRDGERDMHELVSRLVGNLQIPLMLDSTEWQKMEAGLKLAVGKCIHNSKNYEDGEPRFVKVVELARDYGAALVVGTIDEEGMARAADLKVEIARRAIRQANALGLPTHDNYIDPLAHPISTGIEEDRRNAAETVDAIRRIAAEFPDVNLLLGISNVSFGLNPAARLALNSVFLHTCVEAGLTAAIVNASKIVPLTRLDERAVAVARELIFDERRFDGDLCTYDPLAELTTLFEGVTTRREQTVAADLPIEERL